MRTQSQLLHSRTRVRPRYALFPLEGIPFSRLPEWPNAFVRVLAGPSLGAGFVEYLLDMQKGQGGRHEADGQIEFFFYILSGEATLTSDGRSHTLVEGGYALVPPNAAFAITATAETRLLMLRKPYEPAAGIPLYPPWWGASNR